MLTPQATLPLVFNEDLGLPHFEQTDFFSPVKPILTNVERFFKSLKRDKVKEYSDYWKGIQPQSANDHFLRYLFAFMSVHTAWEANVVAYNKLKDCMWIGDEVELEKRLVESRVGLHNSRKRFLTKFTNEFWTCPAKFIPTATNTKVKRDELYPTILGLGIAKTSFAMEMMKPIENEAVCMDTHLFQIYGLDQAKHTKLYRAIEDHWNQMSKIFSCPNYIARCLFWDINQGKTDSRYWSYCLE